MKRLSRCLSGCLVLGVLAVLGLASGHQSALADDSTAAFRVPPAHGMSGLYWLTASDFTPGESVSVTLTAPDGETCPALDIARATSVFSASIFGGVGTTVAPALCAQVQGQWTVTFQGDSGRQVSTTFAFGPNQIVAVPYLPVSK